MTHASLSTGTLDLAVVGHTNTGKTSLLRTLARDPAFGDVQDLPGTTRHVEGIRLLVEGKPAIELFDTPGIEDSVGLRDYLDQLNQQAERLDGPDQIRRFLDSPESKKRFEQEARVLRKLLDCDAALYVVDVRDPVLAKHRDELTILASCGRPILPTLNFTHHHGQQAHRWREALAELGLHVCVEFDTIAPALDGEEQLYTKLALMLEKHAVLLDQVRTDIVRERKLRYQDALKIVAELLIDVSAFRLTYKPEHETLEQVTTTLHNAVRKREHACIQSLLSRYNFRPSDYPAHTLPLQNGSWPIDLFSPEALKHMGVQVGKGMAAGAVAGMTVDVFTAGLSMGAAALIGATAGGLWQGIEKFGKQIKGRVQGYQELTVNTHVLSLLALRQIALIDALQRRGHAALAPIELGTDAVLTRNEESDDPAKTRWHQAKLPALLIQARQHPEWSRLSAHFEASVKRDEAIRALSTQIV